MKATSLRVVFHLFLQSAMLARKRAILTIAAIAWGTVAILLLLSFGEGLRIQLDRNRRAMGENIAVIWPGETTKPWKGVPPGRPIRPRIEDVEYLAERMPELSAVIGETLIQAMQPRPKKPSRKSARARRAAKRKAAK